MKKIIIYAISVLVLIIGSYFLLFNKSEEEYTLRLDKISSGNMTVFVTATGTINAVTTVEVGSQVSGTISKLYADFNSIVKEGQVVAQIDPTNLQQALHDAEASLERVQAQYNESQRSFERIKALYEKKLESQANFDASLTNLEVSKASLKQAMAQLEKAKINLAYATIYAPVNGVVIDRKVNVGQTVAASFSAPTLFTIANDLSKMQVQATVDESDIGKISVGQNATFTVDAYPDDTFSGRVSQIRLAPVIIQNVVNYTVVIDFSNDDLKLMPGMTANIKILVAKKEHVIKVPNIALRFQPPTELIDTLKMKEMRESFRKRFEGGAPELDSKKAAEPIKTTENKQKTDAKSINKFPGDNNPKPEAGRGFGSDTPRQGMMSDLSPEERAKFKKLRDSIMNAHGGSLSREEVFAEMQKVMKRQKPGSSTNKMPASAESNKKFDIIQSFPQYQKSSFSPMDQQGRGRIWIKNSQGKLEPVFVRTGLNDGQATEIITDRLKEGDEIVIGVITANNTNNQQTRNPLTGQGQQPGGGMRPR